MENLPLDMLGPCAVPGQLARPRTAPGDETQVIDFIGILSFQSDKFAGLASVSDRSGAKPGAPVSDDEIADEAALLDPLASLLATLPYPHSAIAGAAAVTPIVSAPAPTAAPQYESCASPNLSPAQNQPAISPQEAETRLLLSPEDAPATATSVLPDPGRQPRDQQPSVDAQKPSPVIADGTALPAASNAQGQPGPNDLPPDLISIGPSANTPAHHSGNVETAEPPVNDRAGNDAKAPRPSQAQDAPLDPRMAVPIATVISPSIPATSTPTTLPRMDASEPLVLPSALGRIVEPAPQATRNPSSAATSAPPEPQATASEPQTPLPNLATLPASRQISTAESDGSATQVTAHTRTVDMAASPATERAAQALDMVALSATPPSFSNTPAAPTATASLGAALMTAAPIMPRTENAQPAAPYGNYAAPAAHVYVETPAHAPTWGSALGERVVWLVDNGQHKAKLHINPEHLGPIDVTLTLKGNEVGIAFTAAQAELRGALDLALPQLRDTLAQGGVALGNTTVSSDTNGTGQQGSGAMPRQRAFMPSAPAGEATSNRVLGVPARASRGLLDTYA